MSNGAVGAMFAVTILDMEERARKREKIERAKIRIRKATKSDKGKRGIHLFNPSEMDLEINKGRAYAQDFKTIWVHGKIRKVI